MEKTPEIEPIKEGSTDNRYQELMNYPVVQERPQEVFLTDYKQAEQDVNRVFQGDRSKEIENRWSDLHNILYSEQRCKEALTDFKPKGREVSEIDLKARDIFEKFHTQIFEYHDKIEKPNGGEKEVDHLFVEMNCDQCGCKKFFEIDNHSGKFKLPFVKNGSVDDFVRGLGHQLEHKGLNCPYCWARKDREKRWQEKSLEG